MNIWSIIFNIKKYLTSVSCINRNKKDRDKSIRNKFWNILSLLIYVNTKLVSCHSPLAIIVQHPPADHCSPPTKQLTASACQKAFYCCRRISSRQAGQNRSAGMSNILRSSSKSRPLNGKLLRLGLKPSVPEASEKTKPSLRHQTLIASLLSLTFSFPFQYFWGESPR